MSAFHNSIFKFLNYRTFFPSKAISAAHISFGILQVLHISLLNAASAAHFSYEVRQVLHISLLNAASAAHFSFEVRQVLHICLMKYSTASSAHSLIEWGECFSFFLLK
jgi:hypothetical protein